MKSLKYTDKIGAIYLPLIILCVYVISLIGCRQMAPRPPQNGTATSRARNNII